MSERIEREPTCGDCIHADICERVEALVGFSRDNKAYCGMFLNTADITPEKGSKMNDKTLIEALRCCSQGKDNCRWCPAHNDYCFWDGGEGILRRAAERLKVLDEENEKLREVTKITPQWVSVDERLPEERECVVAFDRNGVAATGYFDGVWHGMFDHNAVTHWMPLPEPPSTMEVERWL